MIFIYENEMELKHFRNKLAIEIVGLKIYKEFLIFLIFSNFRIYFSGICILIGEFISNYLKFNYLLNNFLDF